VRRRQFFVRIPIMVEGTDEKPIPFAHSTAAHGVWVFADDADDAASRFFLAIERVLGERSTP
jgi:hypothetical protein